MIATILELEHAIWLASFRANCQSDATLLLYLDLGLAHAEEQHIVEENQNKCSNVAIAIPRHHEKKDIDHQRGPSLKKSTE